MKKLLALPFLLLTATAVHSQITANDPHKVQPIVDRLAAIDVGNQLLPLVMTKAQIKEMLPNIEKARQNVKDQEKKEADRLKELKAEADAVYANVLKGVVPPQAFMDKVDKLFSTFETERKGVLMANALIMVDAMKRILNDGQRKAAIGVVDRVFNEETKTWEAGNTDAKLRFFGIQILMNERAYDLLLKLSK